MYAEQIIDLLDSLDGHGLVITDYDLLADRLDGLGYDTARLREQWLAQDRQVGE